MDPVATDPPLLRKNSSIRSFTAGRFTYPGIRVFFHPHRQLDKLPAEPAPLPLLVFVHGLGGSVAQFHPLLITLTNLASCLAVDLPGCGMSTFAPTSWDAYSQDALVALLETVIDNYRDVDRGQQVVLVGHSMGTALAARLANRSLPHCTDLADHVIGLIAICPTKGPLSPEKTKVASALLWIPTFIFDLWRAYDRWGGEESESVKRFVGPDADAESKRLQHKFNTQSRSAVFRRIAWGTLPTYKDGKPTGGMLGQEAWTGLDIPVYLIAGEKDKVTPPEDMDAIESFLNTNVEPAAVCTQCAPSAPASAPTRLETPGACEHRPRGIVDITEDDFRRAKSQEEVDENPTTPSESASTLPPQAGHPKKVIMKQRMPAGHAMLYMPTTVRVLAAWISTFLEAHITGRFSQAWQLRYLSREGKWDVKNLEKWKKVTPVSEPIGPADAPVFRAMKTLREVDETHTPAEFVKAWGTVVRDIIDISHDVPVYDPQGLERGGVQYHKFPTVSKIPPTDEEINRFVELVDRIRSEQKEHAEKEGWEDGYVIGVHCHYGFNRTGYFIVCYLIERCGFQVQEAIDEFKAKRPNGIRHQHFLDSLFVRYSGVRVV